MNVNQFKFIIPALVLVSFAQPCAAKDAAADPHTAQDDSANVQTNAAASEENVSSTPETREAGDEGVDSTDPDAEVPASEDSSEAAPEVSSNAASEIPNEAVTVSDQPVAKLSPEPKTHGITFEGGLGVATPFGKVASDAEPMGSVVTAMVTANATMGYRIGHLWFGGSALGGIGGVRDEGDLCEDDDVQCSTAMIRVGANARYYLLPGERIDPFVGLGTGYEWFAMTIKGDGETLAGFRARGLSLISAEAGAQFWHGKNAAFNASLSYSAGEYEHREAVLLEESVSETIPDGVRETHHWVALNLSGVLMP